MSRPTKKLRLRKIIIRNINHCSHFKQISILDIEKILWKILVNFNSLFRYDSKIVMLFCNMKLKIGFTSRKVLYPCLLLLFFSKKTFRISLLLYNQQPRDFVQYKIVVYNNTSNNNNCYYQYCYHYLFLLLLLLMHAYYY